MPVRSFSFLSSVVIWAFSRSFASFLGHIIFPINDHFTRILIRLDKQSDHLIPTMSRLGIPHHFPAAEMVVFAMVVVVVLVVMVVMMMVVVMETMRVPFFHGG